ncbi:hypothetical protein C8R44DRAFT_724372 [Mycena epipterygia]|nr:hypothetical protein C8R44DRAFT_724372 [Mycena epipterygia]
MHGSTIPLARMPSWYAFQRSSARIYIDVPRAGAVPRAPPFDLLASRLHPRPRTIRRGWTRSCSSAKTPLIHGTRPITSDYGSSSESDTVPHVAQSATGPVTRPCGGMSPDPNTTFSCLRAFHPVFWVQYVCLDSGMAGDSRRLRLLLAGFDFNLIWIYFPLRVSLRSTALAVQVLVSICMLRDVFVGWLCSIFSSLRTTKPARAFTTTQLTRAPPLRSMIRAFGARNSCEEPSCYDRGAVHRAARAPSPPPFSVQRRVHAAELGVEEPREAFEEGRFWSEWG